MTGWDTIAMVDWSSGNDRGPTPKPDAIWTAVARDDDVVEPVYHRSRAVAEIWLAELIERETKEGRRLMVGFDFPFGYPTGFAEKVVGASDPLLLWDWFARNLEDTPSANNRFELAARLNRQFPGVGPFWFNGKRDDIADLPRKGRARQGHGLPERRAAEERAKGAFSLWQMGGAGAVGGQAMTGMATLSRLRHRFPGRIAVWPFEPLLGPVAFVEVWPSLISDAIAALNDPIKDRTQVRCLAGALARLAPDRLAAMLDVSAPEEGWIFGLGHETELASVAAEVPCPA